MEKHVIRWKQIKCKSRYGEDFNSDFPQIIDIECKGALLSSIWRMRKAKPIPFDEAVRMATDKFIQSKIGRGPEESFWYLVNFAAWISQLGYHIELTGDEFEPAMMSDKIS